MVRPNQEAIDTFISITGASESVAVEKLEEYAGDLNQAVNAHFSQGDRNATLETSTAAQQDDFMDIDDDPVQVFSREPSLPLLSAPRSFNPFSPLDSNIGSSLFNSTSEFTNRAPFVSHPREVREIPIEVKDGNEPSNRSGVVPAIVEVTDTARDHGSEVHGTVIIDEDDDENDPHALIARSGGPSERRDDNLDDSYRERHPRPSAPDVDDLPAYSYDIEEEMIQAAIEASRREVEEGYSSQQFAALDDIGITPGPQQRHSHLEVAELAHAVSLSLKAAEQEKALREQVEKVGSSEPGVYKAAEVEKPWKFSAPKGRQRLGLPDKGTSSHSKLEAGSSSINDDIEDLEEQPLVRHRTRRVSPGSTDSAKEVGEVDASPPSSPGQHNANQTQNNGNDFPSEWGGISSEEHDEAVMLEAAMFGGIPEGSNYFPYAPHQQAGLERTVGFYPRQTPRPPSPNLTAQRLLREQQDDEYLAALQADREKELKAMEEAEARRLEEQAAREAAVEEERRKEEEFRRKLEEEQEFERQLAAKEASLPNEPASDDENAVTLLVRMPDGSRRGRRFLRSGKLQMLFDFIDVGRAVKPGTYRLVRPYPRRAFSDGESDLTLSELGLTSKQEALYLELI